MIEKITHDNEHNVTKVYISYTGSVGDKQRFLLSSDRHWDNPHSDLKLQKQHLNEMLDTNAYMIDCGDLFCLMQGKYDRRSNKSDIRPEHNKENYLDAVIDGAIDFFTPYASNILLIGEGNHECLQKDTQLLTEFGWKNIKNSS